MPFSWFCHDAAQILIAQFLLDFVIARHEVVKEKIGSIRFMINIDFSL